MASNFKEKIKNKKTMGNRFVNSDEAMGVVFIDEGKKIISISLDALESNPFQPRMKMSEIELDELAISIKENGLLQPISITPKEGSTKNFLVIAGHRRLAAHKLNGKKYIDAIVYKKDDGTPLVQQDFKLFSILENLQREDLSIVEEANAIKNLINVNFKQVDVIEKLGKTKNYVSEMVQIADIDNKVKEYIENENFSIGRTLLYELTKAPAENQLNLVKLIHKKKLKRDELRFYIQNNKSKNITEHPPFKFQENSEHTKIEIKVDIEKFKTNEERLEALKVLDMLKSRIESIKI